MRHALFLAWVLTCLVGGQAWADDLNNARSERKRAERAVELARIQLDQAQNEASYVARQRDDLANQERDLPYRIATERTRIDSARSRLPYLQNTLADLHQQRADLDGQWVTAASEATTAQRVRDEWSQRQTAEKARLDETIATHPALIAAQQELETATAALQQVTADLEHSFARSAHGMEAKFRLDRAKEQLEHAQAVRDERRINDAQRIYTDAWQSLRRLHEQHFNWYPEYREAVINHESATAAATRLRDTITASIYADDITYHEVSAGLAAADEVYASAARVRRQFQEQLDRLIARQQQADQEIRLAEDDIRNGEAAVQTLESQTDRLRYDRRNAEGRLRNAEASVAQARHAYDHAMHRLQQARAHENAVASRPRVSPNPPRHKEPEVQVRNDDRKDEKKQRDERRGHDDERTAGGSSAARSKSN